MPTQLAVSPKLPLRLFSLRQLVEVPLFILIWQVLYLIIATTNNFLFNQLGFLPLVLNAFIRTAVLYFIVAGIFLNIGRYLVFEVLFKNTNYITPRLREEHFKFYTTDRLKLSLFLTILATILFFNRPVFEYRIFSVGDHVKLLGLWLLTDFFFYLLHGAMHFRWTFKTFHFLHHRVLMQPNVYKDCDRFTYIDALGHFAEYIVAFYCFNLVIPLSNEIWLLGLMQWLIIGQFQHGGKDIRLNELPGLEIVRRLLGVHHGFCLQHDLHHTKLNKNFSMTGIFDKLFGTAHPA